MLAAGAARMRVKMGEALAAAKLFDPSRGRLSNRHAAAQGRFAVAPRSRSWNHQARQYGRGIPSRIL